MRLFEGFDKRDLIIGTSGFYAATFIFMAFCILLQDYLLLKKNSTTQYQNNLKANVAVDSKQPTKISRGYASTIELNNETTFLMVVNQVDAIMQQNSEFASISIVLNCNKLDCMVTFKTNEDDKIELAKLAHKQFISAWR